MLFRGVVDSSAAAAAVSVLLYLSVSVFGNLERVHIGLIRFDILVSFAPTQCFAYDCKVVPFFVSLNFTYFVVVSRNRPPPPMSFPGSYPGAARNEAAIYRSVGYLTHNNTSLRRAVKRLFPFLIHMI